MFRKLADITKKILAVDNRGLDDPNTEKALTELAAQLDGKRGYSDSVKWQGASDDLENEDLDLNGLDLNKGYPIGCAVFVFNAGHDIDTNTNGLAEVIDFVHGYQGRNPLAIITHVDVAEKEYVEVLKTVLRIYGVSDIFEVANLTTENELLEEPYQYNLLSLLERCMTDGDETLIFKHCQRKEQQRKKEIENKRKQEEARIAEECLKMAEKERIQKDNQMRRELEEQRRAIQRQWERDEMQAREKREQERDRRYQEAIAKVEREKQEEIRRIMEANKKEESGCEIM